MTDPKSGEIGRKGLEDFPRYVEMDLSEPLGSRDAADLLWGSLAETYAEGGCEMHIHFRAATIEGWMAGDWCAIFNRAEDWFDFIRSGIHRRNITDGSGREDRGVRQAVLVDIGKFVELPKGVVSEPLPSVVRLQPLDFCLRAWRNPPEHLAKLVQVLRGEDGKLGFTGEIARQRFFPRVGHGKIVGQVVEAASEAMKAIPDDDAESIGGRGVEDFDPTEILAGLNIAFGPCSVRAFFLPGSHFGFKALQVVERPVEPSLVVEGHEG